LQRLRDTQTLKSEAVANSEGFAGEASDNLPDPDVLAQEIVEDLEPAHEQFREVAEGSVD
jgi:hypothetical protein